MTRLGPALVLTVLVVLAAGCVSLPGDERGPTPAPAQLEERVSDAEPPRTATATLVTERGDTVAYRERMWMRADGATRTETTDGRYRNVDDGDRTWFYDARADRVTVLDANHTPDSHLSYVYDMQRRYFDRLDVTAVESATVDGRETHHVTFRPPRDETVDAKITVLVGNTEFVIPLETSEAETDDETPTRIDVWIDRETLFPIKQTVETAAGERTWTYADVSFGDAIDDERFEFEPPANATVVQDVHPYGRQVESIAAAESETNRPVAEPTHLPAALERESVRVAPSLDDGTSAIVEYAADDGRSIVVSTAADSRLHDDGGESVAIGDASATKVETRFGTQLEWECGEQVVYLFATEGFDAETALAVAESIDCE